MSVPLPPDEQLRLEELRRYALLDTPPEKAFDDITALATQIFEVPMSTVTLIDEDRQWFKSCVGLETREVGREFAFCAFAILGDAVMIVPDAKADPRFSDSPLVAGAPYMRFYAGAPLKTPNGLNLGALCIIDSKPRELSEEAAGILAGMADLVVREIELRYQIGERRRCAQRLQLVEAAMEQSKESIIITTAEIDLPGPEIVFVNPAFTKTTGYSAAEVIGKTPRILQGPKTDRTTLAAVRTQLRKGEEFSFEVTNYRKDGSDFALSMHISPIRGEHGAVTHFMCSQIDVTERDRAAAVLQQAKEEAERANRRKSEFLSRMSHEFRTPMHAILGFAELLELEARGPANAESVAQIISAGKHLLGLINEVLDIAAVESGKLTFTLEPMSVRPTLEETISLMRPLAVRNQVQLKLITGGLDHLVLCDAQRFKQVMLNLLSNAVKFNPNGGVAVSAEKTENSLRVNVSDIGGGISPDMMAKLFVPFERLGAGNTTVEGAGLGLALSKQIIEAMNGKIGVESTPGEGSTFWVELPLSQDTHATAAARKTDAAAPDSGGMSVCSVPITLLYIEDEQSNLRLVERILARRPDVKLASAMLGKTGLELARSDPPDLLLLDTYLPDMQGEEILRQLRADPRTEHIPVVIVSADATMAHIERLRSAGANDYLTKPIEVRRFLALVDAFKPPPATPPQPQG